MSKAKAAKHNFWNDERLKRNWSLEYISQKINVPKGTVGSWFAGISAPRDDSKIEALCNLFEIDFNTGYNAFYQAERNWKSSRNRFLSYNPDNFWTNIRRNAHESLTDISKATGILKSTLAKAFSGRRMPKDTTIQAICDHYCVDFNIGKEEFSKAHSAYIATQGNCSSSLSIFPPQEPMVLPKASDESDPLYDFWPSQLRNSKFSIHDLAVYLNVDDNKVTDYFIGRVIPNFNQMRMLCALFGGVDLVHGNDAFKALHDRYNNGGSVKITSSDESPKVDNTPRTEESLDIFEIIYQSGKLSYKEFLEVYKLVADKKEKEVLRFLYNQLSFDEYYSISKVLADWCK